jgi:glycosyltransferase involved in cell wall biosynthesis
MTVYPQIEIASYVRNYGHRVTWIIWEEGSRHVNFYVFNGIQIYTTPYVKYIPSDSRVATFLNLIPNTIRRIHLVFKILKEEKYDLISVVDYAFDGLVPYYMKKRYKTPLIFQLQNPLEQYLHPLEKYLPGRGREITIATLISYFPAKLHEYIGKMLLHKVDLVLPISKWLEAHLVEQGIPESKIMSCPSGVDIRSFSNVRKLDAHNEYDLDNWRKIVYVGSLDKLRHLELLIQAFSEVLVKKRNVKLLIIGEGNDGPNLKQCANRLNIKEQIIFTGQIPRREIPDLITVADICVSPIQPLSFYKLSSPIKVLEYMAMAKPVVANQEIYEQNEILTESGGGILVPFDPHAFASSILELLDNPEKASYMGQKGREWVVKNRDYEILARKVEERYLKLLNGATRNV